MTLNDSEPGNQPGYKHGSVGDGISGPKTRAVCVCRGAHRWRRQHIRWDVRGTTRVTLAACVLKLQFLRGGVCRGAYERKRTGQVGSKATNQQLSTTHRQTTSRQQQPQLLRQQLCSVGFEDWTGSDADGKTEFLCANRSGQDERAGSAG